jgi:hypothetical protein
MSFKYFVFNKTEFSAELKTNNRIVTNFNIDRNMYNIHLRSTLSQIEYQNSANVFNFFRILFQAAEFQNQTT